MNLLENESNQQSKFRTKNWVKLNDESRGTYNTGAQIKFKATLLKYSLCDHGDAYIFAKGNITVNNTAADVAAASNTNNKVILKNCAPLLTA